MTLTPSEIRVKDFARGRRGYVDSEVRQFAHDVGDEVERLLAENAALRDRCTELERGQTSSRALEETLRQTLITAQQSADRLKASATEEARRLVADGEQKAQEALARCRADKEAVEKEIVLLVTLEEGLRFRFQSLLSGFLRQLDEMDAEDVVGAPVELLPDRRRASGDSAVRAKSA